MKTLFPNGRFPARFVAALIVALLSHTAVATDRASGTGAATAGGGLSTGGVYANQATLGQAAGPAISGGVYRLASGFQSSNARIGDPPPSASAPIISFVPDQVIEEDTDTGLIPITISDPDTALPQLTINRTSSNLILVRPIDVVFGGTGSNRVMRITPRPNQSGSAIITITVSDPQNHFTSESFLLEVLPVNDPPLLQTIAQGSTIEDTPTGELPILVRDLETPASELVITAHSDNPALAPNGAFTFGGADSNRWVRIQPAPDQFGQAMITIRVSDGEAATEMSFPFTVLPRNDPPTILPLADVTIESGKQQAIELTVSDVDDDPASLSVVPLSDNPTLIPPSSLALTGQGPRRLLTITPAPGQNGDARVGLQVTDPHGATASTSFRVTVTPARKLFAGLRVSTLAGARADVTSNGVLQVSNLSAQPESGVSFELGQAQGFLALQEATQMESRKFQTLTRITGRQDGQTRPLVSFVSKWEGPELDAAKNEVSIETLEIAHEGLIVRHYDAQSRELAATGNYPGGAASLIYTNDAPPANGIRRSGTITVLDQDLNSIVAQHSLRVVFMPFGIVSPRDPASGLPTGKVIMPGGQIVEGVAFSVFSYEGLAQPVEALERVEILGIGGTESFAVTDAALVQDGLRISGGSNTRLGGFIGTTRPGFYSLPEKEDEMLVTFSAIDTWENGDDSALARELSLPPLDWASPGTSLSLETVQTFTRPESPGVIESISTKYTMFLPDGVQTVFKGEIVGLEPSYRLQIFNQGSEVAALVVDQDLNMPDMTMVGPGKPIRVRPGLPRRGESLIQSGITFDAPMTITVGGQTFVGDELAFFKTLGGLSSETEFVEFRSSIHLRSPGQAEYRLTPEEPWDWGDLPAPYMTTAAQNGARHRIVRGLRLGRSVDPESNGRPSLTATGDDRFLDDDEDGVLFTSALVPGVKGATVNINVVAPPTGAFIDAFVDWDGNGNIEDAGGKFLNRRPVMNGLNTFTFDVPTSARPGKTYARFRLSFEGGLDCEGPALSGEVEDHVVRILSNAPPAHPSGLTVVPRGGADLRFGAGGALEITGLSDGGDDGMTLLAPSNVVSRAAGRIVLPLAPPIPLVAFTSQTQPFADGLVLEAHYTGTGGNSVSARLSFRGGCGAPDACPVKVRADYYGAGQLRVRICAFDAQGYVGSSFANSGEVGFLRGNANITGITCITVPCEAVLSFSENVVFQPSALQGANGTQLTGRTFRFLALDETGQPYSPPDLTFAGLSLNGVNLTGGTLGIPDLRVRNPMAPVIQSINRQPNGSATLNFPTEADVFYLLESTDSLTSPLWGPPTTAYQFGTGGPGTLSDPQTGTASRFYRLRVE